MSEVSENKPYQSEGGIAGAENAVQANASEGGNRLWRFGFYGSAGEYFKIWIVNLFLSVITLSFYAPWAKVRRLRYFYGNTELESGKFDFTAVPGRILIGRIVAMILFVAYSATSALDPAYSWIAPVLMLAVMPWLVRSTMRFRARNSKYGNSRFYFSATMKQSYWLFFKCAAVTVLSLGLLYPLALYWFKSYQINHLHIGSLRFNLNTGVGGFYGAVLKPLLMLILLFAVAAVALVGAGYASQHALQGAVMPLIYFMLFVPYIAVLGFFVPLTQGYLFRAAWQNVGVGRSRITTDLNPFQYAWIKFTNYLAVIFTLGLMHPWGAVRLYRYQAHSLQVELNDNPQDLMNMLQDDSHAFGEEIVDVFDFDISL